MALYDVVRLPRAVCSIAFLALLSVAAGGCTSLREAGTCHVAVLSVTRWDDYKSELQPKFVLDANSALTKATPDTMVLEQAILEVFRAKVGLKLAPSKKSPATQPKDANGVGALPPKQISDANLPDSFRSARSEKDPMLEYLAATALYQEVKMLNRYITDASIRNGYKGYVVRLQIAQMPGIRKANYDLYMNIGFYFDDFDKSDAKSRKAFLKDPSTPLVVPLLVTDQVEGALLSRRAERLTEIVLAMSAAYAGISGEANVDAISQSIERALGRSYNSLLTVGRQGDNVLRVRLGARQIPGSRDEYLKACKRRKNVRARQTQG